MKFVNRAKEARIENTDEIPFAHRKIRPRNFISATRIYLTIFLFIISSSAIFLFLSPFFSQFSSKLTTIDGSNSSKDALLLGHFPYPEVSDEYLIDLYPGFKVHKDTLSALLKMRSAAAKDGVYLVFLSGFRSVDLQREIFYENKSIRNQIAIERAKVSAPPGYSEHATGFAVDIGDRDMRKTDFETSFESTPAFRWLLKNAAKYHFVLSFPKDNIQKVSYEPWHWRFEGTVEALRQFEAANRSAIDKELPK